MRITSVVSGGNGSGTRTWVTLAVPPDLVEQLIAATQSSTLYLTLPSPDDSPADSQQDSESQAQEAEPTETSPTDLEESDLEESDSEDAPEPSPEERSEDDDA